MAPLEVSNCVFVCFSVFLHVSVCFCMLLPVSTCFCMPLRDMLDLSASNVIFDIDDQNAFNF